MHTARRLLSWVGRLVLVLWGVAAVLSVVSLGTKVGRHWLPGDVVLFFDTTSERNLPSWYSTGVLLTAGLVAGVAAVASARGRARPGTVVGWWGLSSLLLVMSLDELVSLHERVGRALRPVTTESAQAVAGDGLDPLLGTAWILPGIVVTSVIAVAGAWWYRTAPRHVRGRVVLGFGTLATGALGLEIASELLTEHPIPFTLAAHLEEMLEMCGGALMLGAVLRAVHAHTWLEPRSPVE